VFGEVVFGEIVVVGVVFGEVGLDELEGASGFWGI
jgi:hypothetical protein